MNRNELAPDNDSTGKLQQSHVIDSLLFKADEKFAETIEKGVRDLNAPAACVEVRVALQLLFLLAWGADMWSITALFYRISTASIARVQAQILWMLLIRFWARHYHVIQSFF